MVKIIFVDHLGVEREVMGISGQSLMEAARDNDIPGIDAECGGMCACATCHVFIDTAYLGKVGQPNRDEEPLLEFVDDADETSRLSCQIELVQDLDGIRVTTPENQGL